MMQLPTYDSLLRRSLAITRVRRVLVPSPPGPAVRSVRVFSPLLQYISISLHSPLSLSSASPLSRDHFAMANRGTERDCRQQAGQQSLLADSAAAVNYFAVVADFAVVR